MLTLLARIVSLRPGEGARVLRMFSLLGLVIATSYILKPVRSALFLSQLGAERLPYVYILVALVLGVVAAVFSRLVSTVDLSRLFVAFAVLFSASLVVFWFAVTAGWSFVGYVFYVWVSIFTALMPSLFWLLANYVFYASEGRRVFSVVTAGGLAGSIVGGVATSLLVSEVGTAGLLLVAAAVVVGIAALVRLTTSRERDRIRERRRDLDRQERVRTVPAERRPFRIVAGSRYLSMLTGLVLLASLSSTLLDYQFSAVVERTFDSRDDLTRFFGGFFAFISVVAFLLQLLVAGRILGRFGVIAGLALLPAALFGSSLSFLFWPSLGTAALLKTSDDGLGNSINRASLEVLYLPVALGVKNRIKAWVDLFVERSSRGVAGLVILGASALAVSVSRMSLVLVAILIPWMLLLVRLRRAYVETFRDSLARRDITDLASSLGDPTSLRVFHQVLAGGDQREIAYALELLEGTEDPTLLEDAVRLSSHDDPWVRSAALRLLRGAATPPALDDIERRIADENVSAGAEALALWMRIDPEAGSTAFERWVEERDPARISAVLDVLDSGGQRVPAAGLSRILERYGASTEVKDRALVAKAMGFVRDEHDDRGSSPLLPRLKRLIDDPDVEVARAAADSAGRLGSIEAIPMLVRALGRRPLRTTVRASLARLGPEALVELERILGDETAPEATRLAVPRAMAEIVDPLAVDALFRALPCSEPRLHYQVVKGLSRLRSRGGTRLRFPRSEVDRLLVHERGQITNWSRHLLALVASRSIHAADEGYRLLISVVEERIEFARERIFRLLGLVYPQRDMAAVWSRIAYAEPAVRSTALEYLANVLSRRHRRLLFDWLEMESGPGGGVETTSTPLPLDEAIERLVGSDDPWLAACAATAAGRLGLASLAPVLERSREHPSPLVREAVLHSLASFPARSAPPGVN